MTRLYLLASIAIFVGGLATATPVGRDVFVPPVVYPNGEDIVWNIGKNYTVKWDTSNPPKQITNKEGKILLFDVQAKRIIDMDHPLASNFDIMNGKHEVTCPCVKSGPYQIIVYGDSGNMGKPFSIQQDGGKGSSCSAGLQG